MNRSRAVLLIVLAAAAAAVLADRAGLFGADPAASAVSPRDDYTGARAEADRRQAVIDSAPRTAQALEQAESAWRAVADASISAPTRALAQSQFRERVIAALRAAGVSAPVVNERTPTERFDTADTVQPVALAIRFETPSPIQAYDAIRALESMPALWTAVERAQISTQTVTGRGSDVNVEISLTAIAVVAGATP